MSPTINYQLYYERYKQALEECWEISTDNSITEENKVKMIRDVSRGYLDGAVGYVHNKIQTINEFIKSTPEYKVGKEIFGGDTGIDADHTTANEYNEEEDVQLGASIVKSNKEVSGVFMVDGEIKDVDYFEKGEELE